MKLIAAISVLFAASFSTNLHVGAQASPSHSTQYIWERAIDTGKGCFEYQNCPNDRWAFAIKPLVANDELNLIGQKSIWMSRDGITWQRQAKTDWGERHGMTFAHFAGKFWMMGGMRSWDKFKNDVWHSTNGTNWTLASTAPWPARRNHGAVVFDGKLWIIGGAESSGRPDQTPTRFYNDVWNSSDGIRWRQVTSNAAWPGRDNQQVVVFNNKLWMLGGTDHRDVWSSPNGKDWTRVTEAPWSGRRGAGVVIFKNKIWIFGGVEHNDVWSSTDGKTWHKVFEPAPWSTRGAEHSVVFRDAIWIYAGKTGRSDSWEESGDVWKMRAVNVPVVRARRRTDISINDPFWIFLFYLFR